MNPDRLLRHFDRIAEAPDAVARLRRFLLDLAVRGKLVEQDPNDEPTVELLKRIRAEKTRLLKRGEIKMFDSFTLGDNEQLAYELPDSWSWVPFGELINSHLGGVRRRKAIQPIGAEISSGQASKMWARANILTKP
jgi:type I restriction enzyme S subunit